MDSVLGRWRTGPLGPPPRPAPLVRGSAPIFTVRPWDERNDGDAAAPVVVDGRRVVEVARVRRDVRGALCVLEDGSFAITGPLVARGNRALLSDWVRRRIRRVPDDAERAWWEEVLGALAL
jgi:cell volume regulation protein A